MPEANERGIVTSKPAAENTPAPAANYYLLVIGVDHYNNEFKTLSNPVRDANRIAKLLTEAYTFHKPDAAADLRDTDATRYGDLRLFGEPIPVYDDLKTTCLYNEKATKSNIIKKMDAIDGSIKEEDALLVYFAGHGVHARNNRFYLTVSNSKADDRGTWLDVSELTGYFSDFKDARKCRHFLLVLDCCYAGSSMLGPMVLQKEAYSRYILTSSKYNEKASDGPVGEGSPFARTLESVLNDNSDAFMLFDEQKVGVLQSRFDMLYESKSQRLDFGFVAGGNNGQGYFVFEKREKDKPKPTVLRTSLIDYLNFNKQRGALEDDYKPEKNHLNIIITQGYSYSIQKVLSKVVFRWLSQQGWSAIAFQPSVCFTPNPVKVDNAVADMWEMLYNNIKDDLQKLARSNAAIHDYFFQKLIPAAPDYFQKQHVILVFETELGGAETYERFRNFCNEFSTLFFSKCATLPPDVKKTLGKMFILLSDERLNGKPYPKSDAAALAISNEDKLNWLLLQSVQEKCINDNHVRAWANKIISLDQSRKIQELNHPDVFKKIMKFEESCAQFDCRYEEFIARLCEHCGYNTEEEQAVSEYLFKFKNELI